jgi:aryl-alcohol dehydrogenase-like predicted oxidoreductase
MQLGLGTVQFGGDYGVSNPGGRTPPDEVARILALAEREDIGLLDTAALYGDSEAVLGGALRRGHKFRIVSKTLKFDAARISQADASALRAGFENSLRRLRQDRLYGLLVHAAADLLRPGGELLWAALNELKREGLVEKIGVSVYTGEDIEAILLRFRPDLVQLPLSVLDQRLIAGGQLARLKAQAVEIHARSIFLQGLLLMEDAELPSTVAQRLLRSTCRSLS